MVTRPVRERSLEKVDELLKRTLKNTGYEEVSLVSLSTCDHSRVKQLVENTVETVRDQHVAVGLPSLRLDSFSVELSDMVSEERKSGLTFAPEAASPRLRGVINKWIPDEGLLEMSAAAYAKGWGHVKLYFMIGLPTERDDDIVAIADLASRTLAVGKAETQRARVNLGVSTFVPKPFTPFQWSEQINPEETMRKQAILRGNLRSRDIKFGRHDPKETFLEGLVSRADRRAGDLLEAAFRKGCRFDAWGEHLRFDLWMEAVEEIGYDVVDALRERSIDERLPWDHIDVFIPKSWFVEDYKRAMELKHAEDCRHKRCHRCGVIDEERELCASMLRENIEGRKLEEEWERKEVAPRVEPDPVQWLRFRIGRGGRARYLGHLEVMSSWVRSMRRAGTPLSYSRGFHPHPRVAFSAAVPVGQASSGDYMDIVLTKRVDPQELLGRVQEQLPDGFEVTDVSEITSKHKSLMSVVDGMIYRIELPDMSREDLEARVRDVMESDTLMVQRKTKVRKRVRGRKVREKTFKPVNIRPMIQRLELLPGPIPALGVTLVSSEGKPGKARELLAQLTEHPERALITKLDSLIRTETGWESLSASWKRASEPSSEQDAVV
jgi:radical SAM-linked protein